MSVRTLPVPDLLASRARRTATGCLEWTRGRDWDGYGIVTIDGCTHRAHRLAYEIASGSKVPRGLVVRHTCDNPPCIDPAHLIVGTVADNNRDREERGRSDDRNGEHCPTAKLTWDSVRTIRSALAAGATQQSIADRYSVTRECISRIARGINWRPDRDPAMQNNKGEEGNGNNH